MKHLMSILALVALLAACQSTNNAASGAVDGVAQANNDGMICRNERETGSNMRVRVCRTPEQIEREQQDAEDALRDRRNATLDGR